MKNLRLIFLLLAMMVLPLSASAYQVSAKAEVSRAEVAKGETFTYKLSIIEEGQAGTPAQLAPPEFTGFNVTGTFSSSSVKMIDGKARAVTEQEFRMSSELPGEHLISPARVIMTDPAGHEARAAGRRRSRARGFRPGRARADGSVRIIPTAKPVARHPDCAYPHCP